MDGFVNFLHSYRSVIFWGLGTKVVSDPETWNRPRFFDNAPSYQVSSSYV